MKLLLIREDFVVVWLREPRQNGIVRKNDSPYKQRLGKKNAVETTSRQSSVKVRTEFSLTRIHDQGVDMEREGLRISDSQGMTNIPKPHRYNVD